MGNERKIITYGNYFLVFYNSLTKKAQEKIDYGLMLLKREDRISKKFVKHIIEGIYELRAEYKGNAYRILFIFDKDNIVLLLNGFHKKSQKTPIKEIEQAKKIKREYYERKESNKKF